VGRILGFGTAVRIALVIAAFGAATALAHSSDPSAWKRGLRHSSAAPAKQSRPAGKTEPGWLVALRMRSEALDRKYGLETTRTTQAASGPAWYVALMLRSDALDRTYHLGRYADAP
jgi:hypothetical protein